MRRRGAASLLVIFSLALILNACWIPLPEETAIVVQVMNGADPNGIPVDGVHVLVDGDTLVTGARSTGQVFKSLSVGGSHSVQVDTASLVDPQGGSEWVLRGSHISGESPEGTYLAYADRGFALGDTAMPVPVADGFITVVTVYLDEMHVSPADNQWLTDGQDTSSPYRAGDTDEFASTILPTFRWRQAPSLAGTVNFTFQLWQDTDGDTRFPLGIRNASGYGNTLSGIQPDWEVPLAGLQSGRALGTGQVLFWSSRTDGYPVDQYDLYFAPTTSWNNVDWEQNLAVRDVQWTTSGGALFFTVGPGAPSPNDTPLLKNGTGYTFGLRARDASGNLDTLSATSTRNVTPPAGGTALGSVNSLAFISSVGGQLAFTFNNPTFPNSYRIYAGPASGSALDARYIRKTFSWSSGASVLGTLTGLVNGTTYYVGVEPFAANGDVGVAGSPISAAPGVPVGSTPGPSWVTTAFTVSSTATPGQVLASWGTAAGSSTIIYRLYHAPGSVASSDAGAFASGAYPFMDTTGTSTTVGDLVNGVSYGFAVRAIDSAGNGSSRLTTTVTLPGSSGPVWDTESPSIFSSVRWASFSTVYPLGWAYSYNGFPLGQNPSASPPEGEYVWRVIQDSTVDPPVDGKLNAFYTYNGYYYFSTESGALKMAGPSSNVDHLRVFSFMEAGTPPLSLASDIMGSPLDSSASPSTSYQQRPDADFAGLLDSGTAPFPPDPDQVNQMVIQYNTDEDGEAVFSKNVGGDFLGILKISAMNRTTALASQPPYLQSKEFLEVYNDTGKDLEDFPNAIYPLLFSGALTDPDYRDPELAP